MVIVFISEPPTDISMMVKLRRTWILTSIIYLVLLFDIAELQDIKFPKSKDEKAVKVDKGMLQKFII